MVVSDGEEMSIEGGSMRFIYTSAAALARHADVRLQSASVFPSRHIAASP